MSLQNFLRKIYRAGKYYFKVASAMIGLPSKVVNKHFITNNVFTVPHKTFRDKTLNFHENMTEHDQNLLSWGIRNYSNGHNKAMWR